MTLQPMEKISSIKIDLKGLEYGQAKTFRDNLNENFAALRQGIEDELGVSDFAGSQGKKIETVTNNFDSLQDSYIGVTLDNTDFDENHTFATFLRNANKIYIGKQPETILSGTGNVFWYATEPESV